MVTKGDGSQRSSSVSRRSSSWKCWRFLGVVRLAGLGEAVVDLLPMVLPNGMVPWGIHPMHFDHVNTTNPMERVYSSWDWQHEFKTFPELNQERQIDENWFISPMAMSQVLVCPPLLNEPERINGMPWVEPYRKTCKRIGRNHTERRTILESWSLRDCPLHCLQAFYPWPGLTESRNSFFRKSTTCFIASLRLMNNLLYSVAPSCFTFRIASRGLRQQYIPAEQSSN